MRTTRSSSRREVPHQAPPRTMHQPREQAPPGPCTPPVDRHTPVIILPCPKLRLTYIHKVQEACWIDAVSTTEIFHLAEMLITDLCLKPFWSYCCRVMFLNVSYVSDVVKSQIYWITVMRHNLISFVFRLANYLCWCIFDLSITPVSASLFYANVSFPELI